MSIQNLIKGEPDWHLKINQNNNEFSSKIDALTGQRLDTTYQVAGGTATAITLTINGTLTTGYPITFIASANNNSSATTINGKKLYKPNTTIAPNLISGKAYTVWYNASGDNGNGCFFIKASAEGDADVSHVLATKKFSNDNDTGLTGTMPNNSTLNYNMPINGSYTIPLGYTTGGTISQSITTKSAQTYNPSTTAQTISSGQYLTGNQTIAPVTGNATINDVVSGKVFSSANGINLVGQATIESLGGVKYVTGTCTGTTASGDDFCITTLSLSFAPKIVRVSGTASLTVYNSGSGAQTAISVQVYAIYLMDLSKALIGDININTTANNKLSYSVNSVTSLNNIPIQHAGSSGYFMNNSVSLIYEAWA